ncbi:MULTISPECIES: HAD domain-containing protein [unclassified Crossiella]|uniref:HAD domain-containing protein n=1 Tax=unclassified Crossiella TaxID=2620835 RepID=UPI001FFE3A12|nr:MULTISPECIES: HAD domain-containing protein [unclassified Crossiella]MCK2240055.1 HAD domain-containing protein [Crossiella sp. S99.2]MCK2252763.1 HAD domain-containing protein [Crossiella sp. S99.1]
MNRPGLALDVDGVLAADPRHILGGHEALRSLGYHEHHYDGPGPDGMPASGPVWLNPEHGFWLRELLARDIDIAWATSWGHRASEWIAPRLELPALPVIEVPNQAPGFGWSAKLGPIRRWIDRRPLVWIDDVYGGKEHGWAEDRRDEEGIPTLLIETDPGRGLQREHIDAILSWLDAQTPAPDATGTAPGVQAHRDCITTALRAGGVTGDKATRATNAILAKLAKGMCPRCGAALGQFPGRSRMTPDRCIRVCGECSSHEGALTMLPGDGGDSIEDWPLDASEIRVEFQAIVKPDQGRQ